MNKYKKLVNNSVIFTIGTFGSRLISFLMVPLYTHILTTSEYGTVDLMNTTISLFIPILTLELGQAALRFSIATKNKIEQNKIFSNITTHAFLITLLTLLSLPILLYFRLLGNYVVFVTILLILRVINNLYSQYIRGIGLVKEFAINGIIMTIVTVTSNFFLLVILDFKVEGYLLSLILAALVSNLYMFYVSNGITRLRMFNPNRKLFKDMLVFSVPIIPNSAMWWIINSSTRYFILYFIGSAGNGIYAVANKVPGIISMATGIFSQAWQLSSFEEYESDNKDSFYTKTFNIYWVLLFIAGSALVVILKPFLSVIVEDSFYVSWQIAPILVLAVIYQSLSSFVGTNYSAAKETKGTFFTSIYAGIISLISSILFIPNLGLIGAGLSSAISFFALFMFRFVDTQKYARIDLNTIPFVLTNLFFLLQTIILFIYDGIFLFIIELIMFLILLLINKTTLNTLFKVFYSQIRK